ncbi:MAG TPA: hypothetical protein VEX86_03675 [Longimicrobium sp.]|nr:hypothetical protein [Longimicrobium sp.]
MLRATIWRDLRWRVLAAALPVLGLAALVAASYASQPPRQGRAFGYGEFLDATWFWLPGPSTAFLVSAVVIAAGGSLLRPHADLAYLLALPVSRGRWLLAHAAMSLAALAGLVLVAHAVLAAGALWAGAPLAILPLLARSLAVLLAASAWVGVTLGVLALVRVPVLAGTLVLLGAAYLMPDRFELDLPVRLPPPPMLSPWDPWAVADPRAWEHGAPLGSLAVTVALGLAGMLLAHYRIRRFEP